MKVQDFAYRVSKRTIELLEENQHYKVSDEARKRVTQQILAEIDQIMRASN